MLSFLRIVAVALLLVGATATSFNEHEVVAVWFGLATIGLGF